MSDPRSPADFTPEFLRLFSDSSRSVYWLIRAALVEQDAADDVFQETSTVLWRKFGEYQPGTNFTAWAHQIARLEVLKYREHKVRDRKVFGEAFVERTLAAAVQVADSLDHRRDLLADCFNKLTNFDRNLITRRYEPGATSKQLAGGLGRSESYVSKALARIHRLLFECISRREAESGESP